MRYFASARSAGTTLPWQRHARSPSRTPRLADPTGLDIALFSAGATSSTRARPEVRRRRRHRDRQLVGVADGSRRAADRQRGQRRRDRQRPQGHHRQPELHDDGGDAGAQAAARRGRPGPADRQHLPGRQRRRPGRRRRARQAGPRGRRPGPRADPRRRRRGVPDADQVRQADRVQRAAVRRQARRRRLVRDRRGAEAAQREPQDPRHPRTCAVSGTCVRVPVFTGHSLSASTPSSSGRSASRGPPSCSAARARRRAQRHPDAARGGRPGPVLRRSHPPGRRRSTAAAAWRCSSATTTSARAPRSTPSRSPSCSC